MESGKVSTDEDTKIPIVPYPPGVLPANHDNTQITRHDFRDKDFLFGSATSAYQEDIRMMKQMGFNSYRFSISWTRVLPGGRWSAGVNKEGIDFYNDVIDTITKYEMEPHVTLFHFDLPQCLEKEYQGFLNRKIVDDFREYAELCFWEFGDRVKLWTTINEPWAYAFNGYVTGSFPPNKPSCTLEEALRSMPTYKCSVDSKKASKAFEKSISIAYEFLDPILRGSYPDTMKRYIPHEAKFKPEEIKKVRGSIDFLGFNYYTTHVAKHDPNPQGEGYLADRRLVKDLYVTKEGLQIGEKSGAEWLYVVPWGLHMHLKFLKDTYKGDLPPIHITENGYADKNIKEYTAYTASQDQSRVKYYQDHLAHLLHVMKKEQVIVKGYYAWSWCDNFEWKEGYKVRFGIIYVDFNNDETRYPKLSAMWFAKFLKANKLVPASKKRQIEDNSENEAEKKLRVVEV
ncbi:Raucaffricine-O-beta-D-glucosidase [Sesamum angolense]|uniref:Raucaffricine-O-beta-D-glucosidase n=1 Tax=Sesamum angolense TaxID=2727404 RepID=A0AAE1W031_9LAMI|nr:Raucaffricine-O-beta-D-glucosidase [Sesamum angolense]